MALGIQSRVAKPAIQALIGEFSPAWLLSAEEIAGLTVPVLLYWGLQDGILGMPNLANYKAHLPKGSEVYTVASEGHAPWMDGPLLDGSESFVPPLISFWRRVATG